MTIVFFSAAANQLLEDANYREAERIAGLHIRWAEANDAASVAAGYFRQGLARYRMVEYAAAHASFQDAMRAQSKDEYIFWDARALAELGRPAEALALLDSLSESDGQDAENIIALRRRLEASL